jgi:YVTN family beta-propeller protein
LAWLRALSLGLLGVMLASTPAEAKPFAYVTSPGSGTVSVIDTETNTVVATVPVGGAPREVAITPDGTHAYVANVVFGGDSNVSVFETATNAVVATVPVEGNPDGVAITPDGTHAYVTIRLGINGAVSVIATETNTVVATVPMGTENHPFGVAITPDGTHAYVVNGVGTGGLGIVSVLATATNTVVANVRVGWEPFGVAITPDGTHAYVANSARQTIFPPSVSVIETATNTEVATVPVGRLATGVAITPVKFACPLGQSLWKNRPDTWPVTSLTLGSQTYTQAELLTLFDTPPRGDASVILAHQLIAAKLNIANGSNPNPIRSAIADADKLLSQFFGKLPYNVGTSSDIGQQMVNDASVLDRYNNGDLTPDCRP